MLVLCCPPHKEALLFKHLCVRHGSILDNIFIKLLFHLYYIILLYFSALSTSHGVIIPIRGLFSFPLAVTNIAATRRLLASRF